MRKSEFEISSLTRKIGKLLTRFATSVRYLLGIRFIAARAKPA